jgi:hypothetical protein
MGEGRLVRLSEAVLADRHARGAQALGWFRYRQAACGFGGQWLRLAVDWTDEDKRDAKTDEGLGLTLRTTGRLFEAAGVAWRWQDSVPLMQKLYIDTMVETLSRDNPPEPVDEIRLKDFVGVIQPIHSALGAQALGWYRLERHEVDDAARWFKQALDWWPQQRRDLSQRLSAPVDDYQPILAKLALAHEDYRRTPRAYPNSSALVGKSRELYVNTEEGLAKTEEGYAQTLRELGRLDEAEAIASAWRDRWPSLGRLYLDIVADALNKDAPEIAPERLTRYAAAIEQARSASAATAFGWRQLRAHDPDAAAKWFARALAWSAEPPDAGLVEGYVAALQARRLAALRDRLPAQPVGRAARLRASGKRDAGAICRDRGRDRQDPLRRRGAVARLAFLRDQGFRARADLVPQGSRLGRRREGQGRRRLVAARARPLCRIGRVRRRRARRARRLLWRHDRMAGQRQARRAGGPRRLRAGRARRPQRRGGASARLGRRATRRLGRRAQMVRERGRLE